MHSEAAVSSGQFHLGQLRFPKSLPGDGSEGSFGKPQAVHSKVSTLGGWV